MLTIKVISQNGYEMVKETSGVSLRPASETARQIPCVTYFDEKDNSRAVEDIYEGVVYVMNENGKTIAKYELFPLPQQTGSGAVISSEKI